MKDPNLNDETNGKHGKTSIYEMFDPALATLDVISSCAEGP